MSDIIRVRYVFGDVVYLKVRTEKQPGMVTGIIVRPGGTTYGVTWNTGLETNHYDFELSEVYEPSYDQIEAD